MDFSISRTGYGGSYVKMSATCEKSPDGKHRWMHENKFEEKCIFCEETVEALD